MSDTRRRVIFWGTYDDDKPRVRILRDGLRDQGYEILEINANVWRNTRDKSVSGPGKWLLVATRIALSYVALWYRLAKHRTFSDLIVVPYLGQFDVLAIRPLAHLLKKKVFLDIFISLYDTVVQDRALLSPGHPASKALRLLEQAAIRAAEVPFIDTAAHARWVEGLYDLPEGRIAHVHVGVEDDIFRPQARVSRDGPLQVLFYGQLSPLHGVETILAAAKALAAEDIDWLIVGTGQTAGAVRDFVSSGTHPRVRWREWVPYGELPGLIADADVCLGIFGSSGKAASVIPNKAFQVAAVGRHLVTRDGPGIRELFNEGDPGVSLVPPEDAEALAAAIRSLLGRRRELRSAIFHNRLRTRIGRCAIGRDAARLLQQSVAA